MAQEDYLEKIYQTIFKQQQPINLQTFNEEMTISQVIKFFAKYNILMTKTMIQNYIRIGLLPGPIAKRYYIKDHLILLFLVYNLKESFSLEELKIVFSPILQDTTTFEDDLVTSDQLYHIYAQMQQNIEESFKGKQDIYKSQIIESLMKGSLEKSEQKDEIKKFMLVFYTMLETISMRKLSVYLIKELFEQKDSFL